MKHEDVPLEIPKIIHFIWLGSVLPEKYLDNLKQWRQVNPEYKILLWVDHEESKERLSQFAAHDLQVERIHQDPQLKTINDSVYFRRWCDTAMPLYSVAANLLRYSIIYLYGGIYADCDVWCTSEAKSLDNILAKKAPFFAHGQRYASDNCFFASAPGNRVFLNIIAKHVANQCRYVEQEIPEQILSFDILGFSKEQQNAAMLWSSKLRPHMEFYIYSTFGAKLFCNDVNSRILLEEFNFNLQPHILEIANIFSAEKNHLEPLEPSIISTSIWDTFMPDEYGYVHGRDRKWLKQSKLPSYV